MKHTFQYWLSQQHERQDEIGGLARALEKADFSYVQPRRKPDEHRKWANIVTRHGEPEHVLAFNHAWREYQTAKRAVSISS